MLKALVPATARFGWVGALATVSGRSSAEARDLEEELYCGAVQRVLAAIADPLMCVVTTAGIADAVVQEYVPTLRAILTALHHHGDAIFASLGLSEDAGRRSAGEMSRQPTSSPTKHHLDTPSEPTAASPNPCLPPLKLLASANLSIGSGWDGWAAELQKERDEAIAALNAGRSLVKKSIYKCMHCGSSNVLDRRQQTRGGDEGETVFLLCLQAKCMQSSKFHT